VTRAPDAAERAVYGVVLLSRGRTEMISSCAGLTRASINLQKSLAKMVDCRVKPGNDGFFGTVPALRSGMKNAAARPGNGASLDRLHQSLRSLS
jgi:hypothetical protein